MADITETARPGAAVSAGLRIAYVAWAGDAAVFGRAARLGFTHAMTGPCAAPGEMVAAARAAGVGLLLDVVLDKVAAGSPLLAAGAPFELADPRVRLDPRIGRNADAAVARLGQAGDAAALAAWWVPHLQGWQSAGVTGFRLLGLEAVPSDARGVFFAALRQALPGAMLLPWTARMTPGEAADLVARGADAVCVPAWPWVELAVDAPVIGVDGVLPEPGRPHAPAGRRIPALAAIVGQGWLHVMQADQAGDDVLRALNTMRGRLPVLSGAVAPVLPLGDGGPVVAVLQRDSADQLYVARAVLAVVNTDASLCLRIGGAALLPASGGVFGPFEDALSEGGAVLHPDTELVLPPGAWRVFCAAARRRQVAPGGVPPETAKGAGSWARLAIENPTPCVDGGAFPVKAVAGEMVRVQADIVFDGHEEIAAALRWLSPGGATWREVAMQPLGNDRWEAGFPLEELGRHAYVVAAWRDRFGTFADEIAKKAKAGVGIAPELSEGEALVRAAAARQTGALKAELEAVLARLDGDEAARLEVLVSQAVVHLMAAADDRPFLVETQPIPVDAERIGARFASWYEVFPRSLSDDPNRHGTFADVERHLPRIAGMGFDVLYFPPISPIGTTNRKGRNNTLTPAPDDPGSPYAVGSAEGGHDAIHPQLGSLADFQHLRAAAAAHGLELAIDFAIQCAPDHPWLKQHPGWFAWRPDGTIKYAENPPKKYEDIVNVDFYARDAVPGLWVALCDVVLFWAAQGVRLFRVDNPHTKPFPFWQWMIGEVRTRYPDAVFLAEAFTRPKVMYRLAKVGFSQSYTYFTWRNTKAELIAYLTELDQGGVGDFFRPHFFVNTPDINPVFLQTSGRAGFVIRAALAATLSGLWGVYNGFELCEAAAIPGREEYADSEKYQLRAWDWDRPGNIISEITALNRIRRANPALQTHRGVTFLPCSNDMILFYEKATPDRSNVVLVAVSLDPFNPQEAQSLRLTPDHPFIVQRVS
jgi:starch synthase (maltosyl-transferring)